MYGPGVTAELWTDFAVRLVEAIAWPGVAAGSAVLLRKELRALVGRVVKARVGPAEFELESVRQAVIEAETVETVQALPAGSTMVTGEISRMLPSLTTSATGTVSPPVDAGDLADDTATVAELLRYQYVRQIVELAERALPPEVPRPEIGHGSLSAVLHLVPDAPPVVLRAGALADTIAVGIQREDQVSFRVASRLLALLREIDAFGRSRPRNNLKPTSTEAAGIGTFVATNYVNSDSSVVLQLAVPYSGDTTAVACYIRRRGEQGYVAAGRPSAIPRRSSGNATSRFPAAFDVKGDLGPGDYVAEWWAVSPAANAWDMNSRIGIVATDGFTLGSAPPAAG